MTVAGSTKINKLKQISDRRKLWEWVSRRQEERRCPHHLIIVRDILIFNYSINSTNLSVNALTLRKNKSVKMLDGVEG